MKRNTKIKDYFAAKSRKSESSGIMDDVCMAFCLFCILRVGTDDKSIMHDLGEICILKRKLMGFFFQKHFAVSKVHFLVHKMLDFMSKPPRTPYRAFPWTH